MNEFGEYWARSPHLLYVQEYRYQDIKMKKLEIGKVTETQILVTFLRFCCLKVVPPVVYYKYTVYRYESYEITANDAVLISFDICNTILLMCSTISLEL